MLVFNVCREDMVKSTLCLVFDGELSKMGNIQLRLTVVWHEKYVCKWVKQVGIDTLSGEKPGIWFRHEIVGESP